MSRTVFWNNTGIWWMW